MTKEVHVLIEGTDVATKEVITTKALGKYREENGKHYVTFEESVEDNGLTRNVIKFTKDQLTVRKDGPYHSYMVFDPLEESNVQYTTPYGILNFNIKTLFFELEILEAGIGIKLTYEMSDQGSQISTNQLKLKLRF